MSIILVGLHCTVDCTIRVSLYCAVGIAMTGIYYSLCMFSYRMPVKLTGGATIGVNDTT